MMAMKVVNISGTITQNSNLLRYRLCPSTEFSVGQWQMAISTLCVHANQDINAFLAVTSNASVSQKYINFQPSDYQQPLNVVYINLKQGTRSLNRFSYPLFIDINRVLEEIDFYFTDSLTERAAAVNAQVSINVLFRRKA